MPDELGGDFHLLRVTMVTSCVSVDVGFLRYSLQRRRISMKKNISLLLSSSLVIVASSLPALGQDVESVPRLQGATNGTIGPKGADAVVITGLMQPPTPVTINEQLGDLIAGVVDKAFSRRAAALAPSKIHSRNGFHNLLAGQQQGVSKEQAKSQSTSTDFATMAGGVRGSKDPRADVPSGCGLVKWHSSLERAVASSRASKRPVFVFEMMGRLDRQFC